MRYLTKLYNIFDIKPTLDYFKICIVRIFFFVHGYHVSETLYLVLKKI